MKDTPADARCATCVLGRASRDGPCPFHEVQRPAGSELLRQGEVPEHVWFLRSGTVLLSATSAGGDEVECALRGPGALLGLEALSGAAAGHQAWALSDVVLCRVDSAGFRGWVGDLETPAGAVARLALDEGERRHRERVALSGPAERRVARFLLEHLRLEGQHRPLAIEQRILGRMLGMTPETLSRVLARLREAGALAPGRGVRVISVEILERLAERP